MNLRNIINGWYTSRFKPAAPHAIERLKICADCPFNSKNKPGLLRRLLPAYCMLCKCELKAKTACSVCACDWHKWGPVIDKEKLISELLQKKF